MWHPISKTPQFATGVELYFANAVYRDQSGNITELPAYRDCRREFAYWDGETWRYTGTGHEVFEFDDIPVPEWQPTHWRILDPPPSNDDRTAARPRSVVA